jgi:ferredoxin/flavodoxin
MENIVFYFSGTGNCLKVAKILSKELENSTIVSMAKSEPYVFTKQYDSIGIVYPTYFQGLPKSVRKFLSVINFDNNKNAYFYAITTFGGFVGNGLSQVKQLLLEKHNIKLNCGHKLQMYSNYVVMYDMSKKVAEITKKSDEKLVPIINAIKKKENNNVKQSNRLLDWYYNLRLKNIPTMDRNYNVNTDCIGCGICKEVCPVKNIEIINKRPQYKNNCEQCVACIQYCPQKAINYKNLTQNRRRYTNPEINYKELSEYNK